MTDNKSVSDILSSVLENKELMSKISGIVSENKTENKEDSLSDVIAAISESMHQNSENRSTEATISDTGSEKNQKKLSDDTVSVSSSDSYISSALSKIKGSRESAALLRAVKPFLSKERCELVDNILKFEQLASLIDAVR